MIEFANSLEHPCLLFTITRRDGEVDHITNASNDITISATTWTAHPGLIAGVRTSRNDGTPPTMGFQAQMGSAAPLMFSDVVNGKYDGARVQVWLANQSAPTTPDFVFDGLIMGEVSFTQHGIASFDLISLFAPPRGVLLKQFSIMCRWQFGDQYCRKPVFPMDTFPHVFVTTLSEPPFRNATYALGATQRYRFDNDGTPEDFHNVYLEAQVQLGVTGATEPTFSDVVDDLVTDGTQIWKTMNSLARAARIANVDKHLVTLDRLPDPRASDSAWYQPMKFYFATGEYTGRAFKASAWDAATLSFETYLPCALAAVGDWIEIAPDCNKTHTMCHEKWQNTHHYGGFPFQIGAKAQAQQLGFI